MLNAYMNAHITRHHGSPMGCSTSWCSSGGVTLGGPGACLGSEASLAIAGALAASGSAICRDEAMATKLAEGIATETELETIPREADEEDEDAVATPPPMPPPPIEWTV